MPFIPQSRRELIASEELKLHDFGPGDHCYVAYKKMVDKWKAERRWTTAHNIYKVMLAERPYICEEAAVATELAWQVFFLKYVMKYEDEKESENGTI